MPFEYGADVLPSRDEAVMIPLHFRQGSATSCLWQGSAKCQPPMAVHITREESKNFRQKDVAF